MWADIETSKDFLNFGETAELVADLIDDPSMLPVSVGVFGGWGAGKSSLLRLLEDRLKLRNDVLIVKFDAWLYQGFDDARAALIEVVAARLTEAADANESVRSKIAQFSRRVNYLRLAGMVADAGLTAATGGIGFGAVTTGLEIGRRLLSGDGTDEDAESVKKAASGAAKAVGELKREASRSQETSPQKEIAALRSEYADVLGSLKKRLIVFIDNIDRCLPRNAIQTLEAIRLFLFLPSTAFVVAADEDMIRHAVREHYSDPTDRHVSDYLDKLIQIPVRVPRLGVQEITAYLFMLFASARGIEGEKLEALRLSLESALQASWKQEPVSSEGPLRAIGGGTPEIRADFSLAERLAPILAAEPVEGNPRIVKRLLNSIRMRSKLAARRKMPLDETIIAKLALFERCTGDKAFAHLCSLINDSKAGRPEVVEVLESSFDDPEILDKVCPELWKQHQAFLKKWLVLHPPLAGVDLRAAVYLSREIAPLRVSKGGLSVQATECFNTLMTTKTNVSFAAKQAIAAVESAEHLPIMEALISEIRRATDWQTRPPGLVGAACLAEASQKTNEAFRQFLVSLPLEPRPLWLQAMLKPKKA